MKKHTLFLIFILLIVFYGGSIFLRLDNLVEESKNPIYQEYIEKYRKEVKSSVSNEVKRNEEIDNLDINYGGRTNSGSSETTGNFEGSQVHLESIKFHTELLTKNDVGERLKEFSINSAHFDPDHPFRGLPDVKINIQNVRLYKEEKDKKFLNFLGKNTDEPKPYKVYKKKIYDTLGFTNRFLLMQLWLTEFKVTIDIRPDEKSSTSRRERKEISYPGHWYGSALKEKPLSELDKEDKDSRYHNLAFNLKVLPDNSPTYYKTNTEGTKKAEFAIAGIYCKEAIIGSEPKTQRISTNVHSGVSIALSGKTESDININDYKNLNIDIEKNANAILNQNDNNFIWNKPYYFHLFFNNLGTWRDGLFKQNEFHDQVTYKFIMPIFVIGSWDVIAPQEILPEWDPPKPYIRKFTLESLLPFGDMGIFGKLTSSLTIFGILFLALTLIFPNIIPLIIKILKPKHKSSN